MVTVRNELAGLDGREEMSPRMFLPSEEKNKQQQLLVMPGWLSETNYMLGQVLYIHGMNAVS